MKTPPSCRPGLRAALVALLACASAASAEAEEYRLGVLDKVRIRVVEWQTVDGTFREWTALSGDYTVGAAGTLSIPFVGEADAQGRTTLEISQAIAAALQQRFGLPDRPEASVEVATYRPIYVTGDVENPGEYAFAPGLDVAKALSLAGGLRGGRLRTERDFITAKGNHDALEDQRVRLEIRRIRLDSEAGAKAELVIPESLGADPVAAEIAASETAVMKTRQEKLDLQLKALADLQKLLETEIVSLETKLKTQRRQMELAQKELQGVGTLAERGYAPTARVFSAERTIAEIEGRNLDLETQILRARQEISKARQDEINLTNTMRSDIAVERQQVEAELADTRLKIEMYRGLMAEAIQSGSVQGSGDLDLATSYVVVRNVDGRPVEMRAAEATAVRPGDLVRAVTVLPGAERGTSAAAGQ